jgi:sigma-B regulation protein RsbU (phosphoserine phosphatase)
MSIKWKYFIILLCFSLLPFLAGVLVLRDATEDMVAAITGTVEGNLTHIITQELLRSAENADQFMRDESVAMELGLRALAARAERRLAYAPPKQRREIYFSGDFEDNATAPPDLAADPKYQRRLSGGGTKPIPVSFGNPVFLLAPGVDPGSDRVTADLQRLAGLTPAFQRIFNGIRPFTTRMHITLDSGVTVVYPGFSGYPSRVDARKTKWYRRSLDSSPEPEWTDTMVSRSTGEILISVTKPLFDDQGRPVGVAAIDGPVTVFLQEHRLSQQWSQAMHSFLVVPANKTEEGGRGLRILAHKGYKEEALKLMGLESKGLAWLEPPGEKGEKAFRRMIDDMAAGRSGTVQAPYRDPEGGEAKPAIWAYTGLRGGFGFVLMTPRDAAMTVPDHVRRSMERHSSRQLYLVVVALVVIALGASLVAFFGARAGSRFILKLSEAWRRLADGDFSVRVAMHTGDERDRLVDSFNETVPKLAEHVYMRQSLELAEEVQKSLLPSRIPRLEGFDVAGESRYCDETGGDYFDVYKQTENGGETLSIIVGDVTGHGVAAALLMASVRAMFRALARRSGPLKERVGAVNELLSRDVQDSGNFVTLFYLEIQGGDDAISWVRAGHDPGILYHPQSGEFSELSGMGLVLGAFEEAEFEESQGALRTPGEILLIGTDGIWEAHDAAGEMFGKDRVREIVRAMADRSAEEIKDAVLAAVREFQGEVEQEDDITLAVVKKV